MRINIQGLDHADVLAALYNASRPQGMGFMSYDPKPMTKEEAERFLGQGNYFDYLKGRVMKIHLDPDESSFESGLYDRDNGQGAAERAVSALRGSGQSHSPEIEQAHKIGTRESATSAREMMYETTSFDGCSLKLGLNDVADVLAPKVEAAEKAQEQE